MGLYAVIKKIFDVSSLRTKVIIISMLMLYLAILVRYVSMRFNTADPIPDLRVKMEKVREARLSTVRVRTGLFVKNIPLFDEIKNQFIIDSIIWFDFNYDELMLKTIEQFSIDNGKIIYKSVPDLKIRDGRLFAKYNVLFEVRTDLRHYRFPFDDHRLSIILSNDFVTPDEMAFLVDRTSFGIAPNLFVSNWTVYDTNVNFGYSHLVIDEADKGSISSAPKALFMINFAKAGFRKILIIFLPIFAAVFLSMCSFLMGITNLVGRVNLSIAGVTALLGYRFVIEAMMPKVGYFTITDEVYLILLVISFLCFLSQLLTTRCYSALEEKSKRDKHMTIESIHQLFEKVNNYTFVFMILLMLGFVSYILLK